MLNNILLGLADDLADSVGHAPGPDQRAISIAVSELAVDQAGVDAPLVAAALQSLQQGIYKDERMTASLRQLVEQLDDAYFAAKRRFEQGAGKKEAYQRLFYKARAANAVLFAFNDDPFVASTHATYETCAVAGTNETRAVVTRVLAERRTRRISPSAPGATH